MQDTSVLEVGDFGVGVDSALDSEGFSTVGGNHNVLSDLEITAVDVNVELLGASKAEGVSRLVLLELEGQDAHSEEVASVDALVALSDHDLDTLEVGALGSPIARGSRTVLFSSKDDGISAGFLVLSSSIEDSHLFSRGDVDGSRASLGDHLVDKSHVGESTTGHDLVVSSAGSVRVKVLVGDSTLSKEASSRGVLSDLTGGRDVISGDGVTHVQEAVGVVHVSDGLELSLGALEEGRVVDVGGVIVPRVKFTGGGFESLPHLGSLEDVVVDIDEHLGLDASFSHLLDFIAGRPDVSEENVVSVLILTKGLGLKVMVDGSSKGVGNHKRRRGQVVGTSVGVDSALEVSVSGEDGGSDHVVINDGVLDLIRDISRVTDASHTTVTGGGETELLKVGLNSSFLEVFGDDVRSGGEGALDVGPNVQALLDSVAGEHTSLEHDIGVGGVGARSDSSNHERSLVEVVVFALVVDSNGFGGLLFLEAESLESNFVSHALMEVLLHGAEIDSIVGSLGAGKARDDIAEVELHNLSRVVRGSLRAIVLDEHILGSEVVLNLLDVSLVTTSQSHASDGHFIDGEVSHGGSVLRGHVGNSSTISEGKLLDGITEELNKLANDSTLTEHLHDSESQISGSGLLGELSGKSESDNLGKYHGDGLSEHDSLSFDTTDTPSGNTETVNHSSVGIGSDDGVRVEEVVSVHDDTSEVLQVDLMDDTRARRDNLEVVEGLGSPLQELEALSVSLEFHLFVDSSSISCAGLVDLDGVINDEVNGHEGVNLGGVSTEALHGVSHGSEIDDSRDTSEVLEDDTGR